MSNSVSNSGGIGFFSSLTIAFIVLKLIGIIGWSWFWVLSPIIITSIIGIIVIIIVVILNKWLTKDYSQVAPPNLMNNLKIWQQNLIKKCIV